MFWIRNSGQYIVLRVFYMNFFPDCGRCHRAGHGNFRLRLRPSCQKTQGKLSYSSNYRSTVVMVQLEATNLGPYIPQRHHWVSSALLFIGGVHIGVRALLDINFIWFGYIARSVADPDSGSGAFFTTGSGILSTLDPRWEKIGSGINIQDPQHWSLLS